MFWLFSLNLSNLNSNPKKTTILFLLFFVSLAARSQTPIDYSTQPGTYTHYIVESTSPIDQSASGANLVWNFTSLTTIGNSSENNHAPSTAEIITYPNTTNVNEVTADVNGNITVTNVYSGLNGTARAFTGINAGADLELNYSTSNGILGTFPLSYGYTNTDAIAGTYVYGTYSGTFTGTIVTSVDAYGTLNTNDVNPDPFSQEVYSGNATRLKVVQNISLNYGPFTNVGTVSSTAYSYHDQFYAVPVPIFRTSTTTINVPLLSINDTVDTMEKSSTTVLSTAKPDRVNFITIAPNPVENELRIAGSEKNVSLRIDDISGKEILRSNSNITDVGQLQKGIYFALISTAEGQSVKKFVKK